MFKLLNAKETESLLLHELGSTSSDCYWEVGLSQYPRCFRLYEAFQLAFSKDEQDLMGRLTESALPGIPEGQKVTVVLEMTPGFTMRQLNDIYDYVTTLIDRSKLERFATVYLYEGSFESRITFIYHDANRRRSFCSRINSQTRLLRDLDFRIAAKLDEELDRNDVVETAVEMDVDDAHGMLSRHHLLWTDVANTTRSSSEIVKRFSAGMARTKREFDVSGIFLFFEIDRDYTTLGEVNNLKNRLVKMAGDVEVAFNVRIKDSYIKTMTCRAVLIGGIKHLKGDDVYEDFGQFEILLYESEDKERGHEIIASISQGELTISRYDWGDFDRNHRGETDDHHYFDEENTDKLFTLLRVKTPNALLRTIRRRFASRLPSGSDSRFLAFCRKEGVEYRSDYHY